MDTLYRKIGKKYVEAGCDYNIDKQPKGLWFTQKTESGSRGTSLSYWFGDMDINKPIDVKLAIKVMSLDDEVCKYLQKSLPEMMSNQDRARAILQLVYNKLTEDK
jgi:hypothetical protein